MNDGFAALTKCFYCGEDYKILINKFPKNKKSIKAIKAAHGKVVDTEPCQKCAEHMKQGIIIIAVDKNKTTNPKNPYRTGGWFVVKENLIRNIVKNKDTVKSVIKRRVAFIEDKALREVGFYK